MMEAVSTTTPDQPGVVYALAAAASTANRVPSPPDVPKQNKRELSQSKRAAQNRAAQRAFRQRKEGYIRTLEDQVTKLKLAEDDWKQVQADNYAMREYIIHLQARLLEVQGEFPKPPPHLNLRSPKRPAQPSQASGPALQPARQALDTLERASKNALSTPSDTQTAAAPAPGAGTPLEVVAQAVAGLANSEHMATDSQYPLKGLKADVQEDARKVDALGRPLQNEPVPPAAM